MRPTRLTKFTAGALSVTLGAAVLASSLVWPASARAEEDVPVDTKIVRGLMESLGLKRDGEALINYQQRAPLVIPPGRALPPPEKSDSVIANDPSWPKDQDVARRKAEAERARNRNVTDERELEQRPLRPDQLTPGGRSTRPAQQADSTPSMQRSGERSGVPLPQSEMGSTPSLFGLFGGGNAAEVGKFTGEPPRASLTAPPRGYQTPSPDQPYGVGQAKPQGMTSKDYVNDHPASSGQ